MTVVRVYLDRFLICEAPIQRYSVDVDGMTGMARLELLLPHRFKVGDVRRIEIVHNHGVKTVVHRAKLVEVDDEVSHWKGKASRLAE